MHRLSTVCLLEFCLSDCYHLLILVFRFVFYPVLPNEIVMQAKFFKIMNPACISAWPQFKVVDSCQGFCKVPL